jgi:hypothetical protein
MKARLADYRARNGNGTGTFFNKKPMATIIGAGVGVSIGHYTTAGVIALPFLTTGFLPVFIGSVLGVLATSVIAIPALKKADLVLSNDSNRLQSASFIIGAATTTLGVIIGVMLTSLVVSLAFNPFTISAMISAGISAVLLLAMHVNLNGRLKARRNVSSYYNASSDYDDNVAGGTGAGLQDASGYYLNDNLTMSNASGSSCCVGRNRINSEDGTGYPLVDIAPNSSYHGAALYSYEQDEYQQGEGEGLGAANNARVPISSSYNRSGGYNNNASASSMSQSRYVSLTAPIASMSQSRYGSLAAPMSYEVKFDGGLKSIKNVLGETADVIVKHPDSEYATVYCKKPADSLDVQNALKSHMNVLEINGEPTATGALLKSVPGYY